MVCFKRFVAEAVFDTSGWASRSFSKIQPSTMSKPAPVATQAAASKPSTMTKSSETGAGRFAGIKSKPSATTGTQQPESPAAANTGAAPGNIFSLFQTLQKHAIDSGQPLPSAASAITPKMQALQPTKSAPQQTVATMPTAPAAVPKPAPAVTQRNAPVKPTGRNGMLSPQELKQVGTYNATPGGAGEKQWYGRNAFLNPKAADAFLAAKQAYGKDIPINSAYRNLEHQQGLRGKHAVVAQAGTSMHGLGKGLDLQSGTDAFNWMVRNGPKFGWYHKNIRNDPFHFEYKG